MRSEQLKRIFFGVLFLLLTPHFLTDSLFAAQPPDIEEQTRAIASELRCPVCQNLSVADSPAELAQEMRALVREQLEQGKSPDEIRKFFVSKYGDWVLLAPPAKGFGLLLWLLPAVGAVIGVLVVVFLTRRWARKPGEAPSGVSASAKMATMTPAIDVPPDVPGQRDFFLRERERLEAEQREIEFDFQSGKLSDEDYAAIHRRLDAEAAAAGQKLAALPAAPRKTAPQTKTAAAREPRTWKTWQLAAGSAFLLLFGLALGVLLMQATRQRGSDGDSITGGFLTGTPSSGSEALLAQGRAALDRRDYGQAIELFKKVLSSDPNNPEALAYMGLILAQAGHTDGALSAYDRALAADPNFPVALWGKGLLLAQTGGDPAEARRLLEKVSTMMPAGSEKSEVEKVIANLGKPSSPARAPAATATVASTPAETAGGAIEGVIDLDTKSKPSVDPKAVLFIIAKSTNGAGPPLAAKRIANPKFPLKYSLGAADVMMPGTPFSGKVFVSARLSKDGNVSAKGPGDLAGEFKKNPVEVGAKKVDFMLEAAR